MAKETETKNKTSLGMQAKSEVVKDAARFIFSSNLGNQVSHIAIETVFGTYPTKYMSGVLALELAPTIGTNNEGIQAVSAKLYNDLTHKISGAKVIEKPDYFMFLQACKSLGDAIGYLKAVYTLIFAVKTWNKYYPKCLLAAYGIDGDWIDMNINDFRAFINKFIATCNSIYMPDVPYMKSGSLFNRTILLETGDVRHSPTYVMPVRTYMQWDAVNDPNGTMLVAKSISAFTSFTQLKTFFMDLVNALKEDADAVDIAGWVENAYEGKLLKYAYIHEDENSFIDFVSSDVKALSVVENAFVLPGNEYETIGYTDFNIRQSNNYISQAILYNGNTNLNIDSRNCFRRSLLNLHVTKPTVEDIIRAMSLNTCCDVVFAGTDFSVAFKATPDYMARRAKVYTFTGSNTILGENMYDWAIFQYDDINEYRDAMPRLEKRLRFKYRPFMMYGTKDTGDFEMKSYFIFNQLDNYKVLTNEEVSDYWAFMWWDLFDEIKD